jgi:hypothetical protein
VAQLLYDLGMDVDDCTKTVILDVTPPWPPLPSRDLDLTKWTVSPTCRMTPLPLWETAAPYRPLTAAAAMVCTIDYTTTSCSPLPACSVFGTRARKPSPLDIVLEYLIGKRDMATVYMSPDLYFEAFDKMVNLRKFNLSKHRTAGLCLAQSDNRLFLGSIAPSTPAARIPH